MTGSVSTEENKFTSVILVKAEFATKKAERLEMLNSKKLLFDTVFSQRLFNFYITIKNSALLFEWTMWHVSDSWQQT
jgi:hypothetical protein